MKWALAYCNLNIRIHRNIIGKMWFWDIAICINQTDNRIGSVPTELIDIYLKVTVYRKQILPIRLT